MEAVAALRQRNEDTIHAPADSTPLVPLDEPWANINNVPVKETFPEDTRVTGDVTLTPDRSYGRLCNLTNAGITVRSSKTHKHTCLSSGSGGNRSTCAFRGACLGAAMVVGNFEPRAHPVLHLQVSGLIASYITGANIGGNCFKPSGVALGCSFLGA